MWHPCLRLCILPYMHMHMHMLCMSMSMSMSMSMCMPCSACACACRPHGPWTGYGRAISLEGAVAVNVKGEHLACSASAAPIVARVDTRGVGVLLYLKMYTAFFHGFGVGRGACASHQCSIYFSRDAHGSRTEGRHPWAHATCGRGVRVAFVYPPPPVRGCAGTALYRNIRIPVSSVLPFVRRRPVAARGVFSISGVRVRVRAHTTLTAQFTSTYFLRL